MKHLTPFRLTPTLRTWADDLDAYQVDRAPLAAGLLSVMLKHLPAGELQPLDLESLWGICGLLTRPQVLETLPGALSTQQVTVPAANLPDVLLRALRPDRPAPADVTPLPGFTVPGFTFRQATADDRLRTGFVSGVTVEHAGQPVGVIRTPFGVTRLEGLFGGLLDARVAQAFEAHLPVNRSAPARTLVTVNVAEFVRDVLLTAQAQAPFTPREWRSALIEWDAADFEDDLGRPAPFRQPVGASVTRLVQATLR